MKNKNMLKFKFLFSICWQLLLASLFSQSIVMHASLGSNIQDRYRDYPLSSNQSLSENEKENACSSLDKIMTMGKKGRLRAKDNQDNSLLESFCYNLTRENEILLEVGELKKTKSVDNKRITDLQGEWLRLRKLYIPQHLAIAKKIINNEILQNFSFDEITGEPN